MDEAERIVGLYQRHGLAFDRLRGRTLFERSWLDRFVAGLPEGGSILDIGCGSGEPVAAYLIGLGYALTGIDSSDTLITLCRERFPAGDWRVADMRVLSLGKRFEGLIAWHSFFHLSMAEQRLMFPRFAAHAAPGAMLMFTSGPGEGIAIGEFEGEPLFHASLGAEEYRHLLADNDFAVLDHVVDDPGCGGATVWLCRKR